MKAKATWKHPTLGPFKYYIINWAKLVPAPAFDVFKYAGMFGDDAPPNGKYELSFNADNENDKPAETLIALADKVLQNQKSLAKKIASLMYDQFHGRGPTSGMWWYGDMDTVMEAMEGMGEVDEDDEEEEEKAITRPEDIYGLMRLSTIVIHKKVHGYERPVAELCFSAAFEDEHGVGVLTDGEEIVGVGYMSDPNPFKKETT